MNSYSSGTGAPPGQGAGPNNPQAMMMAGRGGRGGAARAAPVTRNEGHNRWVWDVQHESGLGAPPGEYQVRLTVGSTTLTQPLTVLIDPRLADEGLTAADLQEQFEHNMTMRAMVEEVNALARRVEAALERLAGCHRGRCPHPPGCPGRSRRAPHRTDPVQPARASDQHQLPGRHDRQGGSEGGPGCFRAVRGAAGRSGQAYGRGEQASGAGGRLTAARR